MNLLDENILESQRLLLRQWRISVRQIGHDFAHKGLKDEEIIPILHQHRRTTFFTRDLGFYQRRHCHPRYCLVVLAVGQYEAASFVRRLLRHPEYCTQSQRLGRVVQVSHAGLRVWEQKSATEEVIGWNQQR